MVKLFFQKKKVSPLLKTPPLQVPTFVKKAVSSITRGLPSQVGGSRVVASPFPLAAGAGAAGGVVAKTVKAAKGLIARATVNPFAATTLKAGLQSAALRGAGVAGTITGARAIYAAASGEPFVPPSLRALGLSTFGGALTTTPIAIGAGLLGFGKRGEKEIAKALKDVGIGQIPFVPTIPEIQLPPPPQYPPIEFTTGGTEITFPPATDFGVQPSAAFAPSFSVGGTVGGGQDYTTLLLLGLLGGGALGYGLGRRRRKRKSRKRRKKKSKKRRYY